MSRFALLVAAFSVLATSGLAQGPVPQANAGTLATKTDASARSGRPKVVVVPILNQSGEKWTELRDKQIAKATEFVYEQFGRRGFDLVPALDVKEATEALKIDFTDEEQQKRATLFELGKKLDADYILFGVITHTEQKEFERALYKDIEGRTDAKIWFLDVRGQKPVLSAKTFTGRSGGNRITLRPSDRQVQAAANAFRDGLKEFFKDYPESK